MRTGVTVSTAELARQLNLVERRRELARTAAGKIAATVFVSHIAERAPRDTNRYVASVIQAGQDLGVEKIPRPAIVEGRNRQRYLDRLSDQARFYREQAEGLERAAERIESKLRAMGYIGGTQKMTKWSRGEVAKMRRFERAAEKAWYRAGRAMEEMMKAMGDKTFVAIFGSAGKVNAKGRVVGQRLYTVRVGVYGGYGRMIVSGNRTGVQIVSREPHATIVEKKRRLFASAMQSVSVFGARRIQRSYFDVACSVSRMYRGTMVAA